MTWLRVVRHVLWGLVAIAAAFAAAIGLGWWQVDGPGASPARQAELGMKLGPGIGGPFSMTDHRGKPFTEKDIQGRPTLIFFGFTFCPDVCPTTLSDMSGWLQGLGSNAEKLNAIFVSVDPERDTVEQMAHYLSMFDPRITGLTGTPDQLRAMAETYRFFYKKVPLDGGDYTMDHTAMVYMLDRDGTFVGTIDYHEERDTAVSKIHRLLKSNSEAANRTEQIIR